MPGLATHVLLNSLIGKILRANRYLLFFIIGGVLPDVLTRIPTMVLEGSYWYVVPFHTPVISIITCYLISLFFREPYRISIFLWLYSGTIFHFIPDALQKHLGRGYSWLFPFSWESYTFGLFWPEDSLYFLPVLIIIWIVFFVINRNKKSTNQKLQ